MASFKLGTEHNEELPVVGWLLAWLVCTFAAGCLVGPFVTNRLSLALVRLEMQYSTLTYLKAFTSSMQSVSAKYVSSYFTKKMTVVAWRQHDFELKSFPGSG